MTTTLLTKDERSFLTHMSRWGSEGYPIRKLKKGGWLWDEFFNIKGAPTVYRTKRDVTTAIERYIDGLIDKEAGRFN